MTYAELQTTSPTQRKIQFSSATLGRPSRTTEFKRHEPTIYAQVIKIKKPFSASNFLLYLCTHNSLQNYKPEENAKSGIIIVSTKVL